jgi:hypothetical protein
MSEIVHGNVSSCDWQGMCLPGQKFEPRASCDVSAIPSHVALNLNEVNFLISYIISIYLICIVDILFVNMSHHLYVKFLDFWWMLQS